MAECPELNLYERAIVRNADWFIARQTREGAIDAEGDEFYGLHGDATLVGHSASVRCLAHALTADPGYLASARRSLEWLAQRQDPQGGWSGDSAFTLDGAQCVFEGFNTYRAISGDGRFDAVLHRAADRMVRGTLTDSGELRLSNIIEIGEYAHFAWLAWKTTGEDRFRHAAERILVHIARNYDEEAGYWLPFDAFRLRHDLLARALRPMLRFAMLHSAPRGRIVARVAESLAPLVVGESRPQYAMSLMDSESLIDTLDGSCTLPDLDRQTHRAIAWALNNCRGPFPGSLVESAELSGRPPVYPVPILNDTRRAALWPSACLLIACCSIGSMRWRDQARTTADWIVSMQDDSGGFHNFQEPNGTRLALQSGNVNYYACIALWLFNEVCNGGRVRFFTGQAHPGKIA